MERAIETIENWLESGEVKAQRATTLNLAFAVDWLSMYETDNAKEAQELANAIGFLEREIIKRNKKGNR